MLLIILCSALFFIICEKPRRCFIDVSRWKWKKLDTDMGTGIPIPAAQEVSEILQ